MLSPPLQEQWPKNGLQLCDFVLESLSSFRNPVTKLALQTSSFTLQDSTVCFFQTPAFFKGRKCLLFHLFNDLVYFILSGYVRLSNCLQNEYHSALSGLKNLQQSLKDICYLQTSLQCSLTLSEHEKVICKEQFISTVVRLASCTCMLLRGAAWYSDVTMHTGTHHQHAALHSLVPGES